MSTKRLVIVVALCFVMFAADVSAITASRVTVATTATLIFTTTGGTGGSNVLIRNPGTVSVYLGGSGVTAATGFELAPGDAVSLQIRRSDTVYGIVASGTNIVHVLESPQ